MEDTENPQNVVFKGIGGKGFQINNAILNVTNHCSEIVSCLCLLTWLTSIHYIKVHKVYPCSQKWAKQDFKVQMYIFKCLTTYYQH